MEKRSTMAIMATEAPGFLPFGRALSRTDLEAIPDDGHRYELIDGLLIVSPAPRVRHQQALARLFRILDDARPADLTVLFAPVDVVLAEDTVIQPDIVAAADEAFTAAELQGPPLLAVEVLSPSTRGADLLLKKDRLERAGCPHYWVVDPDAPAVVAWELTDGAYRELARVSGEDRFDALLPFPVAFAPASLLP